MYIACDSPTMLLQSGGGEGGGKCTLYVIVLSCCYNRGKFTLHVIVLLCCYNKEKHVESLDSHLTVIVTQ